MEPDQIGQNLKTWLEILLSAGDVALLLRQNSKTFISVRQIMLPAAVTRILIDQFPHNLERALVLLLSAVQIPLRHQQIAEPIVATRQIALPAGAVRVLFSKLLHDREPRRKRY